MTTKQEENIQVSGNEKIWNKTLQVGILMILLFSVIYFFIAKDVFSTENIKEPYSKIETIATVGEMIDGTEVRQSFAVRSDFLKGITVRFANYGNQPAGTADLILEDSKGYELAFITLQTSELEDNADYYFDFGKEVDVRNDRNLTLCVKATGGQHQSSITMWTGVEQNNCTLLVNGTQFPNTLYFEPDGIRNLNYPLWHWLLTALLIAVLSVFCLYQKKMATKGKKTGFNEIVHAFDRYRFLLTQLVSGDFKNKYRRSYLGILWSLLNPLLMMVVMSIVFSVVFRFSNIPNFQVYLILGQVMFSFYSESTQLSVMSTVGAAQLIKKVYLPKYIFPLSKVSFSFINTTISFVAVFLVIAFYRVPITWSILYLPLIMGSYYLFCLGIGFILSSLMVFIRDTLHFYGIIITILGYLTPIFYSIEAFPVALQTILKFNPLYHYVTALRTVLLYGQPLSLVESSICIGVGILALVIGVQYFHKKQKKFILYI